MRKALFIAAALGILFPVWTSMAAETTSGDRMLMDFPDVVSRVDETTGPGPDAGGGTFRFQESLGRSGNEALSSEEWQKQMRKFEIIKQYGWFIAVVGGVPTALLLTGAVVGVLQSLSGRHYDYNFTGPFLLMSLIPGAVMAGGIIMIVMANRGIRRLSGVASAPRIGLQLDSAQRSLGLSVGFSF